MIEKATCRRCGVEYEDWGQRHECDGLVSCDFDDCKAKAEPEIHELREALIHWKNHPWLGGCSHAR